MPESKKVVIKVDIHNNCDKRKAFKAVTHLSGIDSLAMDKDKNLTITGNIDAVDVVGKLKKWHAVIVSVGPAKGPEKKPEAKKKEPEKKSEPEKKVPQPLMEPCRCTGYYSYPPQCYPYPPQRFCIHLVEEDVGFPW